MSPYTQRPLDSLRYSSSGTGHFLVCDRVSYCSGTHQVGKWIAGGREDTQMSKWKNSVLPHLCCMLSCPFLTVPAPESCFSEPVSVPLITHALCLTLQYHNVHGVPHPLNVYSLTCHLCAVLEWNHQGPLCPFEGQLCHPLPSGYPL